MDNDFDWENDEFIDSLLTYFDCMSEGTVKMIDFNRYARVLKTAMELKHILAETKEQGRIDIDLDEQFNMGVISTQLDDLTVTNPARFAAMIAGADNFEIYPRIDGKLHLNITFQSVLKTIGKESNR